MNTNLIKPESAAHWYTRTGQPCHERPMADGKGMRSTTLRDARQEHLLPSVTSIMKAMANPGLESWKMNQVAMAALTLPKGADEPLDAFAARVVEDAFAYTEQARSFGSDLHAAIHAVNQGLPVDDERMRPWLDAYLDWRLANKIVRLDSEFAVVGDGYAGTVDAELAWGKDHELYLVDFKTQQIRGGEPVFYFSWCVQLAAYRRGIKYDGEVPKCGYSGHQCASIIIDSGDSHSIYVREWSEPELMEGWQVFQACKTIWSSMAGPGKGYQP